MSVSQHHPQYDLMAPTWCRNRHATIGQRAILLNFSQYFPPFVPVQQDRYNRVKQLARYYNATGQTVTSLTGAAFNIAPVVELPDSIDYMIDDADGGGNDLEQVAKQTVSNVLVTGRHGLLADYPATEGENLSMADVQRLGLRASIKQYPAESGINWGEENGKLSYVVLREEKHTGTDFFSHDTECVYRVFWMEGGECMSTVLAEGQSINDAVEFDFILDATGSAFTEIPFVFVGAMDNRASVDNAPIEGLANTNISHFQTSCNHVETVSKQGQVTVGLDPGQIDTATFQDANGIKNGGAISLGADSAYIFGTGGKFTSTTAPETTLALADLQLLEQQMQAQGAQLMDKSAGGQAMTAKQAGIEAKQQVSQMQNAVLNTSDGLRQCLEWCEQMMSKTPTGDVTYEIDTTFNDEGYNPELGNTLAALRNMGDISRGEIRAYMSKAPGVELAETGADDAAEGR